MSPRFYLEQHTPTIFKRSNHLAIRFAKRIPTEFGRCNPCPIPHTDGLWFTCTETTGKGMKRDFEMGEGMLNHREQFAHFNLDGELFL